MPQFPHKKNYKREFKIIVIAQHDNTQQAQPTHTLHVVCIIINTINDNILECQQL